VVGGIFVAFRYYERLSRDLAQNTGLENGWAQALTMLFVLFVVYFLLALLFRGMEKVGRVNFEGMFEQNGGLVLGFLRGCLVMSVLLGALVQLPSEYLKGSIQERSLIGGKLSRVAPAVYDKTVAVPVWVANRVEK